MRRKITAMVLAIGLAIVGATVLVQSKATECNAAWCGNLGCLSSKDCGSGCVCLSDGFAFGKCVTIN